MKVHLKQIPTQGLRLEGEEECPIQDLESEGIRCAGRLHYDIDLGVAGGGLWANGSLSQPVELRCVSCLENFCMKSEWLHLPCTQSSTDQRLSILRRLCARIFC